MVKNSVKSSVVSLLLDGLMKNCEEIITIKDLNLNYLMCNNCGEVLKCPNCESLL